MGQHLANLLLRIIFWVIILPLGRLFGRRLDLNFRKGQESAWQRLDLTTADEDSFWVVAASRKGLLREYARQTPRRGAWPGALVLTLILPLARLLKREESGEVSEEMYVMF